MANLRKGIDFRSNWLYCDRKLLDNREVSPEQLQSIITLGSVAIIDAMTSMFEKNKANNPPNARIHYPWLYTIKLADYDEPLAAFRPEAMELSHERNADSNEMYPRALLTSRSQEYWDAIHETDFVPRVPGRMKGWDQTHDGTWLQIKHQTHFEADHEERVHFFDAGDGVPWPKRS